MTRGVGGGGAYKGHWVPLISDFLTNTNQDRLPNCQSLKNCSLLGDRYYGAPGTAWRLAGYGGASGAHGDKKVRGRNYDAVCSSSYSARIPGLVREHQGDKALDDIRNSARTSEHVLKTRRIPRTLCALLLVERSIQWFLFDICHFSLW